MDDSLIVFDERGLVPCIVQDWFSGEVLTLAYMNADALRLTRETGEMHFFSRSRQELWQKGATSGNTQALRAMRLDCDGDALLALADPDRIAAKVQEEAEEVARAAREETDARVAEEAADVIYHLAVLLKGRGLTLADAEAVLDGRRQR
jgi:phosphoribosyl-ATP pyrophosphohydrolase/phosphoribosyl-AMP cyclohydrolase